MGKWQALHGGPLIIAIGEVLLLVCSVSYLIWWSVTYRPAVRAPAWGRMFLAGAVLGGFIGLLLLAVGMAALLPRASWWALAATILGGVVVGGILIQVTTSVAHRPLTTELPLIIVWATMQLAAGITLRTSGMVTGPAASGWVVAIVLATVVGLACYLVFYRLDPIPAYWLGMVPLAVDGVVAAILASLILTRSA